MYVHLGKQKVGKQYFSLWQRCRYCINVLHGATDKQKYACLEQTHLPFTVFLIIKLNMAWVGLCEGELNMSEDWVPKEAQAQPGPLRLWAEFLPPGQQGVWLLASSERSARF